METKKLNIILIIGLAFAMLVIGLMGGYIIFNKDDNSKQANNTLENNLITNTTNDDKVNNKKEENINTNETQNSQSNPYLGKYTLTFNENAPAGAESDYIASEITLKENGSFTFTYNLCYGMMEVTGNYSIYGNVIRLSNLSSYDQEQLEFNLNGSKTIEFGIISEKELYFIWEEEMFACTHTGTDVSSFIKTS